MGRFLLLFICMSSVLFAGDSAKEFNANYFRILTLLPPVVAIVLAFVTKNVLISLFIGIFSGAYLLAIQDGATMGGIVFTDYITGIVKGLSDVTMRMMSSMADSWNAGILLQVLTIGGLIAIISKMGGAIAVAESLAKRAKSPASTQIITWVLGILVFFDDYANALIVGPIMRPIADKMKISRERLAFIIDATAAPIAGIALISTWIGYEVSLIKGAFLDIGLSHVNAYGVFIETIPYRFYNIFMLLFVFLSSYFVRDFGPMYHAEVRARKGEANKEITTVEDSEFDEALPHEKAVPMKRNALIPIGLLVLFAFVGFYINGYNALDPALKETVSKAPYSAMAIRETFSASDASIVLFQAAFFASLIAMFMAVGQKIMSIKEALNTWIGGMKPLISTCAVLLLAWSLSSVIKELGTSIYLTSTLGSWVPKALLPSIIFILASFIAFATGTSYGTMGILMPLAIPLASELGAKAGLDPVLLQKYIVAAVGAVLTGAIFGDHCSPISDTTIMSSMGSGCDHLSHVKTQLIYALVIAGVSVFLGYLLVGFGVSVYITLPLGGLGVLAVVLLLGKKVPEASVA